MNPEAILALKEIALEFIKIVGSATVAALAAYKTASYQYQQKIIEIEKRDQFKATEMIFDIQKKSFEDVANGYKSITENIFTLSGTMISGDSDEIIDPHISKIMQVYTHKLPFSFKKTYREFTECKDQYPEEYSELQQAEETYKNIGKLDSKTNLDYVVKLEYIYSTLSHCSQIIISEKMDATLSKYTANK